MGSTPDGVALREVADEDLPVFFGHQLDPTASHMAAFTAKDPADREAFAAHWKRILGDPAVRIRTVVFGQQVAGYVGSYELAGDLQVTYWIERGLWGRGIATEALRQFLGETPRRPVYARAAHDNLRSLQVLQKCGFTVTGHEKGFANARGEEIEEVILKLANDR